MTSPQFHDGAAAAMRSPTASPTPSLRALETAELWSRRDASGAREELVRRFLPLARRLARRYRSANEPLEDLVQVASLGLLYAIDRFDPGRGTSFSAYAIPTILGELKRHFRNTGWAVRVPRRTQELVLGVEQTAREMTNHLGRPPKTAELANCMNLSVEDVLDGLQAGDAHFGVSLDAPVATDPDVETLADTLGAVDDRYALIDTKIDIAAGIHTLPHRERIALALRLQLDLKQSEIAEQLRCSQMEVSRLLTRAATRLRPPT